MKYPRIGIYPSHCGIWKNGCDGPYIVRRKVLQLSEQYGTIFLDGQKIQVKRTHSRESDKAILWETYSKKEGL